MKLNGKSQLVPFKRKRFKRENLELTDSGEEKREKKKGAGKNKGATIGAHR